MTRWLTITEASRYASLSRKTIRRMLEAGYLSGDRTPGGHWRIDKESIDAHFAGSRDKALAVLRSIR